jgi:lycopene cyclase domain-containing protein
MTYFGFLLRFLILPLAVLMALMWQDRRRGRLPWGTLLTTALTAVVYTTPWDNYLVASGVWWYNVDLVAGLTLGWVPVEEYLFFILQPLLVGTWLIFLKHILPNESPLLSSARLRYSSLGFAAALWVSGLVLLLNGWPPGRYLSLELAWGMPPLMLQLAFGADILWRERRRIGLAIISSVLYLSVADAIAITSGTWTISPALSFGILIAGVLPVEECLFFLLTSTLVAFSVVLLQSPQAAERMTKIVASIESIRLPVRTR